MRKLGIRRPLRIILTSFQIWKFRSRKRTAATLKQALHLKELGPQTILEETCQTEAVKDLVEDLIAMTHALALFEKMNMVDL